MVKRKVFFCIPLVNIMLFCLSNIYCISSDINEEIGKYDGVYTFDDKVWLAAKKKHDPGFSNISASDLTDMIELFNRKYKIVIKDLDINIFFWRGEVKGKLNEVRKTDIEVVYKMLDVEPEISDLPESISISGNKMKFGTEDNLKTLLFFKKTSHANDYGCSDFPGKLEKCEKHECIFVHPFTKELMERRIVGEVGDKCLYIEEMPNGGRMECRFFKHERKELAEYYKQYIELEATAKSREFRMSNAKAVAIFDGKELESPELFSTGACVVFGYSRFSDAVEQQIKKLFSNANDLKQQIKRLSSLDPAVRGFAAVLLGGVGKQAASAVPSLIKLLNDKTTLRDEGTPLDGRWPSLFPFPGGSFGFPRKIKEITAWAIRQIGEPAVDFLIASLNDDDWQVKRYAAIILGMIRDRSAVKPLIVALKDENWFVQEAAMMALKKITGKNEAEWQRGEIAIESLIAELNKADRIYEVVKALGKIKDSRAVDPLIRILNNTDNSFRQEAAEALGEINDTRAIIPLQVALKDPFIKNAAVEALRKITGKDFSKGINKKHELNNQSLAKNNISILSVALSPDGKILAAGSNDNTIGLWDINTGHKFKTFVGSHHAYLIDFTPDGKILVAGGNNGMITLWDTKTGNELKVFMGHPFEVESVAFSPEGNILMSADRKTIKLWDISTGNELHALQGHYDIKSVVFSPDGKTLASGGSKDNKVRFWNVTTGKELNKILSSDLGGISSVAYSPDGKILAAGEYGSGRVILWQSNNYKEISTFDVSGNGISSIAFSADSNFLAVGYYGAVTVWEIDEGKVLYKFKPCERYVKSVAFNLNNILAAAGSNSMVTLWELGVGNEVLKFNVADLSKDDDVSGEMALIWAAEYGHIDIVRTLLNKGVDVNKKNRWGSTALDIALDKDKTSNAYSGIIKLLKTVGAKE